MRQDVAPTSDRTVPARAYLGEWTGPSDDHVRPAGHAVLVDGPDDNPQAVLRTLDRTVGQGNYHYLVTAG